MLLRKLLALLKNAKNLVFESADRQVDTEIRIYEAWIKDNKHESN